MVLRYYYYYYYFDDLHLFVCRMSALCGMTSGVVGQFLASPADLVKVQMQMEGKRKLEGHAPR